MNKSIQIILMLAVVGILVIVFASQPKFAGLSSTKYLYEKPMFLNIK